MNEAAWNAGILGGTTSDNARPLAEEATGRAFF
ncbi:hypothetical protein HBHAL_3742 [Halobacillus halophilus DSM 2266]|uniref:Uncharacterized protein n=1 Tax=Halobacillus halophilus (strain ATCC 35676 / DSM 2266 / JCM 20832 / KCTC 3685 / LMG 17431 / NBRC 102448 / NCIMB 2269) TaxID=866895 RepID=I0JPL7_HALH3|nr:hypothetical protein HBHAL_3742 [Halobacillus halophilus DSM 2266]